MLPTGRFFTYLLSVNSPRLDDFKLWQFHPGMLFQASLQWWSVEKPRSTPHEGLDLCWFEDVGGSRRSLDGTTFIPAPFAGTIVKISQDFLGQSIFLAHDIYSAEKFRLYTAFGHTVPRRGLTAGHSVSKGEVIASIAVPEHKTAVPPHLHLSTALIPADMPVVDLDWKILGNEPAVTLIDPLKVFPATYIVI